MSSFDKAIIVKAAEKHKQPISNFHEETDSSTRTPYIHYFYQATRILRTMTVPLQELQLWD